MPKDHTARSQVERGGGGRILGHADIRKRRRQQEVKEEILTLRS